MPIPSTSALIAFWKDPGRGCQCITRAPELGSPKGFLSPAPHKPPAATHSALPAAGSPSPGSQPLRASTQAACCLRSPVTLSHARPAARWGPRRRSVPGSTVLPEPGLLSFPGPVRIQQLASLPLLLPRPRRGPMRSCSHLSLDECYGLSPPKVLKS